MKIDISNLFNSAESAINIDCILDMQSLPYSTYYPIKDGAKVKGRVYLDADVVYFSVNVSFDFYGICDRCAEEIKIPMSFDVNKVLVKNLVNEDNDDEYLVLPDSLLNMEEIICEEILLFLPTKILCKEDCKGLCPKCGKNLNLGLCDCKKEINPAMAPLLQLMQEE